MTWLLALLVGATTLVSEGATDVCSTRQCTRTIRRDLNYEDSAKTLHPTDNTLEAAVDPGDLPDGTLSYGEQRPRTRMRCYLVNDDDVDNSTRFLCRRAKNHAHWFRFQAATAGPNFNTGVSASVDRAALKINWVSLWDTGVVAPRQANLIYLMKKTGVDVSVRVRGVNAPHSFQFRVRLPVSWTLALSGTTLEIRNNLGSPVFYIPQAVAWDSPGGVVDLRDPPEGANMYATSYTIDASGTVNGFPWYRFTAAITGDTSLATFPVILNMR